MPAPKRQESVEDFFRNHPPGGVGAPALSPLSTFTGPSAGAEAAIPPEQARVASQGRDVGPDALQVGGAMVGGTIGALAAPETLAGAGAMALGRGALAVGGRVSPALLRIGTQLLSKVGMGTQLALRAGSAGLGVQAAGEFTHLGQETPEQTAERRRADFDTGVAGELVGAGLGAGARQLAKARLKLSEQFPFLRPRATFERLEPGAAEAQAAIRAQGGNIMAGQMTRGFGIDALQNIAQASFSGGGIIEGQTLRNLTAAEAAVANAVPRLRALTPQDSGRLVQFLIKNPLEAQKVFVREAYENFDRELAASGNVRMVDLRPIKSEFDRRFSTALEGGDPTATKISRYLGLTHDEPASFGKTEDIRQLISTVYGQRGQDVNPGIAAYAAKVLKQIDEARDQAATVASTFGPRLLAASDAARAARTTQAKFFDEELIGPLLEKVKPEEAATALWQANNPSQVEALHDIVYEPRFRKSIGGDPDAYWEELQSGYFQQLKRDAGQTHYGSFDGEKLGKAIDHSNGTFEAFFPDKLDQKTIRASVRAMELIQAKPGGTRSGSVLVQMAQGRDVGSLIGQSSNVVINLGAGYYARSASMGDVMKGLGIFFAPRYLAKVMASRPFSDWIQRRALVGASGTAASSAFGQLIAAMMKSRIPFTAFDQNGAETSYDPQHGVTGPAAPTKPQSKYKLPPAP